VECSKIIGFDVSSTSTGYSVLRRGRFTKSTTSFGWIKPKGELLGDRLCNFRDQVLLLLEKHEPCLVVVEDVYIRHPSSVIILARFSGVIMEACARYGVQTVLIETTKARSLLGVPNNKQDSFDYIKNRYSLDSWSFSSHNDVSDSLVVSLAVRKVLNGRAGYEIRPSARILRVFKQETAEDRARKKKKGKKRAGRPRKRGGV